MKTFWIACTIAMAATTAFLWNNGHILTSDNTETTTVEDSAASRTRKIFAGGVVEGERREIMLNFEIAGRIAAIDVREGDRIHNRQILATLDDAILQHELAAAKSRLRLAQAERERLVNGPSQEERKTVHVGAEMAAVRVEQSKRDANRALAAFRRDAITQERLDEFRFRLKAAVAELKRANAKVAEIEASARGDDLRIADARIQLAKTAIEHAQTKISKTQLHAPADGVIVKINVETGERITAVQSHPAIAMVDDRRILVRAYVEELDATTLATGQSATVIADGLPNRRFRGKITWIAPSMQPKHYRHHRPGERLDTRVREVLIRINQPKGLVIGLPVDVFIQPPPDKS